MATQTGSIDLKALKASADMATDATQYFWHNTTDSGAGEGAGAHITEIPREDFVADPANGGANTYINSTTVNLRDGTEVLARFEDGGLSFKARGGQETFKIESSGAATVETVDCFPPRGLMPYGDTTVLPIPRLKLAPSGATINVRIQHGTTTPHFATFTKGTAETKTVTTSGVSLDFDGNYTFTADNQNPDGYDFKFNRASFDVTRHHTDETVCGDITVEGDGDLLGAVTIGGDAEVYGDLSAGVGISTAGYLYAETARFGSEVAFSDVNAVFSVTTKSFSYPAISSGSGSGTRTETFSNPGYYPLGVIGFRSGNSSAAAVRFSLSSRSSEQCVLSYVLRAVGAVSAGSGDVDILWVKE